MRQVADLEGKNAIVYDLEIKKTIEQCSNGWNSYDEMGISVGCAFDYMEMRYRIFMDDNIQELVDRLNIPDTLIVAFNQLGFDNKLLRVNGLELKPDNETRNYDMLWISKRGAGLQPDARIKGFRLDDHLRERGLPMKTADGALAPVWYQEGKIGAVADYCLNDVKTERGLFEDMWVNGVTACAYRPNPYEILLPTFK